MTKQAPLAPNSERGFAVCTDDPSVCYVDFPKGRATVKVYAETKRDAYDSAKQLAGVIGSHDALVAALERLTIVAEGCGWLRRPDDAIAQARTALEQVKS
jgi:hypothetical protein